MEKENTTKTGGEGKEDFNWEGCPCGSSDVPAQEGKGMPEEMSKMFKACCGNMPIPEAMKGMMKDFYQGKSQKA